MQTKIQINPPNEEQLENAGENSSLRHQRGNGAVKKILQVQDPVQGRNKKVYPGIWGYFSFRNICHFWKRKLKEKLRQSFPMLRDPGHGSAKFYK